MGSTQYYPPLAYQSVFDDENDFKPGVQRSGHGPLSSITTPSKATRTGTTPIKTRTPTFRNAGEGPYPSMSTISSASMSSLGSTSAASSLVSPTKKSVSPKVNKKKKLFAPSQASIAMLNPAHAMGIDVDDEIYHRHQTGDPDAASMMGEAGSYESLASPASASRSVSSLRPHERVAAEEDPYNSTPELAAFAVTDLQSALTRSGDAGHVSDAQTPENYTDYDTISYGRPAQPPPFLNSRRRANTMASVFEDDDGQASPSAPSPSRKVAFLIRNPASEGMSKSSKGASSANKSIARFFSWKKGGKSKNVEEDEEPSSAPPHVTQFDRSTPMASPLKEVSPSLPTTPLGQQATLPQESGQLPHRKTGPPPKSILRKQSAPALREQSRPWADASAVPAVPKRSMEAPGALYGGAESLSAERDLHFYGGSPQRMQQGGRRRDPPSPLRMTPSRSTSSDLSRGYSGVGRGVARRASDASSIMVASPIKSPRRKQVPNRFDALPTCPAPRVLYNVASSHHVSKVSNLGDLASQHTLYAIEDAIEEEIDERQSRRRSMAQRVADGVNSYGFEEPAPRTSPVDLKDGNVGSASGLGPVPAAYRRRSRSVGAIESGNPFASAFAIFNSERSLPAATPSSFDGGMTRLDSGRAQHEQDGRTPTQRDVAKFESAATSQQQYVALSSEERRAVKSMHKATDSGNSSASSNSDDLSLSHATTVVATRRVNLAGTRAKATSVSSPSINAARFTGSSSSNVGSSPRLMATPASKRGPSQGPMVTVLPPTPDMPGVGAFVAAKTSSSPLKPVESSEEALRRTWSERNSCLVALKAATSALPAYEEPIEEETEDDTLVREGLYEVNDMSTDDLGLDDDDRDSIPGSLPYDFPTVPPVAPLNIKRRQGSSPDVSTTSHESNNSLSESASAKLAPLPLASDSGKTAPRIPPSFSNESIISGLDELDWHPLSYSDSQTVLPSITTSANLEYAAHVAAAAASKKRPAVPSRDTSAKQQQPSQTAQYEREEEMVDPHMDTFASSYPPSQDSTSAQFDSMTTSEPSTGSMPSLDSSYTSVDSIQPLLSRPSQQAQGSGSSSQPMMLSAGSTDSLSSMVTTGTSILYQDLPDTEVQRYMHRAQLSHDAFSDDRAMKKAAASQLTPMVKVTEESTPRIGDGVWPPSSVQQSTKASPSASPSYPSIKISDTSSTGSPQLPYDSSMGSGLGLSMLGPYEGKGAAPRVSSRRTTSRSPSPALSSRSNGARSVTPTQRSPVSDNSGGSSPSMGYGLGLDLGAGQMKAGVASATQVEYTPTRVLVKDSKANLGRGTWEEQQAQQQQYFYDAQARASRRPRVPPSAMAQAQAQSQGRLASSPQAQSQQQQQQQYYQSHQEQLFQPHYQPVHPSADQQDQQHWQYAHSQADQQQHHHYLRPESQGYESLRDSGEWEMGVAL